jgi:hypothetical protein
LGVVAGGGGGLCIPGEGGGYTLTSTCFNKMALLSSHIQCPRYLDVVYFVS